MKQIEAKIVADSISPQGHRITSMLLTYPRFIHSEVMTHRMFSRNSASSRAIPFEKMVKMVEEDPFIPIAWQKDHKGMQGVDYFNHNSTTPIFNGLFTEDVRTLPLLKNDWLSARDCQVSIAKKLNKQKLTKQLCNRLLEPFMWHTVLVTATEFDNFFELRCPQYEIGDKIFRSKKQAKTYAQGEWDLVHPDTIIGWLQINKSQAEIHIQALAEAMWDELQTSTPKKLSTGSYHLPFIEIEEDC